MATVYLGRAVAEGGFERLVAIKVMHPHIAEKPEFEAMFLDEARLAASIRHPNVVSTIDVKNSGEAMFLVMEYIEGASLSELMRSARKRAMALSPRVVLRIVLDACSGLHAAHEACDEHGGRLGFVHRDVSPQNVLVGRDGIAKIADFGVAKSNQAVAEKTATGVLKGKVSYMAPEYVRGRDIDRRADVFSMAVVAWEALAGRSLFARENELMTMQAVATDAVPPLSDVVPTLGTLFDDVFERALHKDPDQRIATMAGLADAVRRAAERQELVASANEVAEVVEFLFGKMLDVRRERTRRAEAEDSSGNVVVPSGINEVRSDMTSAAVAASLPSDGRPKRSSNWLFLVLGLVIAGGGAFILRRMESPDPRSAPAAAREETVGEPSAAIREPKVEPGHKTAEPASSAKVAPPTMSAASASAAPVHPRPRVLPRPPRVAPVPPPEPPPTTDSPDPNPYD